MRDVAESQINNRGVWVVNYAHDGELWVFGSEDRAIDALRGRGFQVVSTGSSIFQNDTGAHATLQNRMIL
jgi:glutamine phosphoribosylpyrophosphate amidotransferase